MVFVSGAAFSACAFVAVWGSLVAFGIAGVPSLHVLVGIGMFTAALVCLHVLFGRDPD